MTQTPPKHRSPRVLLGAIGITVVLLFALWQAASRTSSTQQTLVNAVDITWKHDFQTASQAASESNQPVLLLATADWCPPCQHLKKEVLVQPRVSQQIQTQFVPLKLDVTEPDSVATRKSDELGVQGIPTMIIFDSQMNEIDRVVGALPEDKLLAWFDKCLAKVKQSASMAR